MGFQTSLSPSSYALPFWEMIAVMRSGWRVAIRNPTHHDPFGKKVFDFPERALVSHSGHIPRRDHRTYRAWGITAAICGVLFSQILGLPAALIGGRYGKKVAGLRADGELQKAISASRKARAWLIASTVLDVIGLVLFVVLVTQTSNSQPNFSNPSVVAASIRTQIQQRIGNPSSQYYEPGVTVTSVVCTPSGSNADHCVDAFSNGQTVAETAVISGNGTSYTTH